MLLSGFYEHDIPVVMEAAVRYGLSEAGHEVKGDNWTCLKLVKDDGLPCQLTAVKPQIGYNIIASTNENGIRDGGLGKSAFISFGN